MNKIAILLTLPYAVGILLFFLPSPLIEGIYGEKNFAYLNVEYLALVLGALIFTVTPFYLIRKQEQPAPVVMKGDFSPGNGRAAKWYTLVFVLITLLVFSSVRDLATYREAASKYAFLVDMLELYVLIAITKRAELRKAELLAIGYVALLNVLTLRRYALIPFLLLSLYFVFGKLKFKRIARNAVFVILSFLLIQFIRESASDGLPVLTLSSAYVVLPWNRLAMLVSGVTAQPYAGEFFYSFTSVFLPPGLPAGSLVWSDALGIPSKDVLSQDLEYKTIELLKDGYLPINWFTLLGDLYSDMGHWLLIYVGTLASLAALAMRYGQNSPSAKILSAYLFTALMLVGTYNVLMFPRFVWMLIAAAFLSAVPKVRVF
jgi:hypothetical protein